MRYVTHISIITIITVRKVDTKQTYRDWCSTQPDLPLFMQGWWMDAVSGGKDWEAVCLPSGAMMPVLLRKRMGMRFVLMPQETQIGGYYGTGDRAEDIAAAIDGLKLAYYYQKYPIGQERAQQLAKYGFRVSGMLTYRIADLQDEEALVRRFSENKRRQLKKAAGLTVDTDLTADAFYRFHRDCLRKQGKDIAYSEAFWHDLYAACEAHGSGQIIALRDEQNRLTAAVFVVYDKHVCYYLIPTYDPDMSKTGAGSRLVLEAIRFAAQHSEVFDFEGSMIPGVAEHYRQFGSTAATYYAVEKTYNPLFRLLLWGNNLRNRKKK